MPLRGLGYVAAATRIASHLPHEQLQVIFVNGLGESINGIDRDQSRKQAVLVRGIVRRHLEETPGKLAEKVMFAEDAPSSLVDDLCPAVSEVISGDAQLQRALSAKSSKHGNDFLAYGTAHVVHHETASMRPVGLTPQEPVAVVPERIVSIGCQQEHIFYRLRMKAREVLADPGFVPTAQIFTKHVLPPYYLAKGGEQTLEDALYGGVDLSQMTDLSAERDVRHLLTIIPEQEIKL